MQENLRVANDPRIVCESRGTWTLRQGLRGDISGTVQSVDRCPAIGMDSRGSARLTGIIDGSRVIFDSRACHYEGRAYADPATHVMGTVECHLTLPRLTGVQMLRGSWQANLR